MQQPSSLKYYLITDPTYYTNDITQFEKQLRWVLQNQTVHFACFRDKLSNNFEELATLFVNVCKEFNIEQILLNENLELAQKLQCGVHLTSQQFDQIARAKQIGLYTIMSCHNEEELQKAQAYQANAVTYSPIFTTPNKGAPKGIEQLNNVLSHFEIPIIALGGIIDEEQIKQIEQTQAFGFASIRYFLNSN